MERWVTWGEIDRMGFCSLTCAVDAADSAATTCKFAPASKSKLVVLQDRLVLQAQVMLG